MSMLSYFLSIENLKEDSRKACAQIRENKYIEGLQAKGYDCVKGYGISFKYTVHVLSARNIPFSAWYSQQPALRC